MSPPRSNPADSPLTQNPPPTGSKRSISMAVPYKAKRDKKSQMVPPWRRHFWSCLGGPSRWASLAPLPWMFLSRRSLHQQAPKGRSPWRYPTRRNVTKMAGWYRHGNDAFGPAVGPALGIPPDLFGKHTILLCFSAPNQNEHRIGKKHIFFLYGARFGCCLRRCAKQCVFR